MKSILKLNNLALIPLVSFCLINTVQAATLELATEPLLSSTSEGVKPNILFLMDDSGSMTWSFLPDIAHEFVGSYGYHSSQCNRIYYNSTVTYNPPVTSAQPVNGIYTRYADSSFTSAKDNGFENGSTTRNLNTQFIANRFWPESANDSFANDFNSYKSTSLGPYGAVYYRYTGVITDRDYGDPNSAFYGECNSSLQDQITGITRYTDSNSPVFQRRRLSTNMVTTIDVLGSDAGYQITSIQVDGVTITNAAITTHADESTTAARIASAINQNSYSATSSGSTVTVTGPGSAANQWPVIAANTSNINNLDLRVDIFPETAAAELTNFANWYTYYRTRFQTMKTSAGEAFGVLDEKFRVGYMGINSSSPSHLVDDFIGTSRSDWYSKLYNTTNKGGTPLREALSVAGRYYADRLGGTDPMQYSCQPNFTLLSSDGYWNGGKGEQLDGSTDVGNQDGVGQANRPQFDGTNTATGQTVTYRRYKYSKGNSYCWWGRKRLRTREQRASCEVNANGTSCVPASNSWKNFSSWYSGSCKKANQIGLPKPNPSAISEVSRVISSTVTGGQADTLADVAQYYYKTDIRAIGSGHCTGGPRSDGTTGDVCENNMPVGERDNNKSQHMNTFTLGLGVNGLMKFKPNYENVVGDYQDILNAETATSTRCTWETVGDTCNWPNGMADEEPQNIDDLWHAAVNGRGTYFSAEDPSTLSQGIAEALIGIGKSKGSAAAASSSSLNPVKGNNDAFIASFTTKKWIGNLESRPINTQTAVTSNSATWCAEDVIEGDCETPLTSETINDSKIYYCETPASNTCTQGGGFNGPSVNDSTLTVCKTQVNSSCEGTFTTPRRDVNETPATAMVSGVTDQRTIYTSAFNAGTLRNELVNFDNAFGAANSSYFDASVLSGLSQWATLTATQRGLAESNIINYLRGQYDYDFNIDNEVIDPITGSVTDNRLFRERDAILGDILESQPIFSGESLFGYQYPGYETFKATKNAESYTQDGTVYVGANDGMLHAFNADNGKERWAYIPSMVVPNLWKLADKEYYADKQHINYINGTPSLSDVCVANCTSNSLAEWKTIVVVGLNAGGRGYFALDVTDPTTPELLWEFTTTNGIGSTQDDDLGFTYAQPVITRKSDGTWVVLVTSGYNNVGPGDGKGYLYVLNAGTGAIISKRATGAGSTTTPSGLGKITAVNNVFKGNEANIIYGGDLLGNVWRFNLDLPSSTAALKFVELKDSAGNAQPITTKPMLKKVNSQQVVYVATGKMLESSDLDSKSTQTVYAIKDDLAANATSGIINLRTNTTQPMIEQVLSNSTTDPEKREIANQTVNWSNHRGWFADLPDSGERVHVDGKIAQGVIGIPSTVPEGTACEPDGYSWLNYFKADSGAPVEGYVGQRNQNPIVGLGLLSVKGTVRFNAVDSKGIIRLMGPPLEGEAGEFTGKRTLWRELIQ